MTWWQHRDCIREEPETKQRGEEGVDRAGERGASQRQGPRFFISMWLDHGATYHSLFALI